MTRISDAASNTALIRYMLRTQQSMLDADYQVASGQRSPDYLGIARDSLRLINLENDRELTDRFKSNNELLQTDYSIMSTTLEAIDKTVKDFEKRLSDFKNTDTYTSEKIAEIQKWAFEGLKEMESYLNTSVGGRYLFSGSKTDTAPVDLGLTTLSGFQTSYDGAATAYATTRDAHLSDLSLDTDVNNANTLHVTPDNWLTFRKDDDGIAGTQNKSSIESSSAQFSGYKAGSRITVSGTASNDGTYTVSSVSSDGTKLYLNTEQLSDETTPLSITNETAVSTVVFTKSDGSQLTNTNTGDVTFTSNDTITVTTGASLSGISVGDVITVSGTTNNNQTIKVASVNTGTGVITVERNTSTSFELADGSTVSASDTGSVTFSQSGDTITATNAAFSNASAGEVITVSGTTANDGTYTISSVSSDGKTVTIDSSSLTDEGLSSGSSFFEYNGATKTVFDGTNKTIQAQTSGGAALDLYSDVQVGDTVAISGTNFNFEANTRVVFTSNGGADNDTIQIQDPAGNAYTGVFADLSVGDTFTIANANSAGNNQTYTVASVSEDGSTVRLDETATSVAVGETDTAGPNFSGDVTFNARSRLNFATATTLKLQDSTGADIANAFLNTLPAGATFTIAGATDAGNNETFTVASNDGTTITVTAANTFTASGVDTANGTITSTMNTGSFTVTAVSSDGSTLTVSETVLDQTDTDGTTAAVSTRSFSASTGTNVVFDATNKRIKAVLKQDGSSVTGVFDGLRDNQTLTVAGTQNNNGTLTISDVASDGSYVDVSETISDEMDGATNLDVYAADGTVATSSSYFQGDQRVRKHRIDESRTLDLDITAADPAFEKAIRAMAIIAQGEFGKEGGLDQNRSRVTESLYLVQDAIDAPAEGTAPYGTELSSDITLLLFNHGFNQYTLNQTIEGQDTTINYLDREALALEEKDPLEAITELLGHQRSLEASYQAMSRVFELNLADFI